MDSPKRVISKLFRPRSDTSDQCFQCLQIVLPFLSHLLLAWRNIGIWFSVCPSIHMFTHQSFNICVNPSFNPNFQVHFPRTLKATVMKLGISLHLRMTAQTTVSIFDLDLYFTVRQFCKFHGATWWNLFCLEMSKSHSLTYLKLKLDSSSI